MVAGTLLIIERPRGHPLPRGTRLALLTGRWRALRRITAGPARIGGLRQPHSFSPPCPISIYIGRIGGATATPPDPPSCCHRDGRPQHSSLVLRVVGAAARPACRAVGCSAAHATPGQGRLRGPGWPEMACGDAAVTGHVVGHIVNARFDVQAVTGRVQDRRHCRAGHTGRARRDRPGPDEPSPARPRGVSWAPTARRPTAPVGRSPERTDPTSGRRDGL